MVKIQMKTRNEVLEAQRVKYQKATKKEKSQMLNTLCESTGLCRDQIIRKMKSRDRLTRVKVKFKRGRKLTYSLAILEPLERVWEEMDYACGKRLAAGMKDFLDAVNRFHPDMFEPEICQKLQAMSASTIDRHLRTTRQKHTLKGRSTTKPGTLLKKNIPIRLGTEWDDAKPGYLEVDLVAHCGDTTAGEYVNTLDSTDIATGWTETRAVLNKARKHVHNAIIDTEELLPFPLLGFDSDNGSEFINDHLYKYCLNRGIVFTRSRPYTKNDNCHVEQKNWHTVRRHIGYGRYEGIEAVKLMNAYYLRLRLLTNFFYPQTKLISKHRNDETGKYSKKYEPPLTPFQRVLNSPDIDSATKDDLRQFYLTLDPIEIRKQMVQIRHQLYKLRIKD